MRAVVDLLGVLVEVWMLYYLYENILEHRTRSTGRLIGAYALAGLLFMLVSTYVGQARVRTLLYLAAAAVPFALYSSKWYVRIVAAMIYMATQTVVEMATKAVFLSIYGSGEVIAAKYYMLGVVISKALALLVIFIIVSLVRVRARTLSVPLFLALLLLPLATMLTIYQLIDISYALNTRESYLQLMLVSFLLIGVNIAMCYLFGRTAEMEEIRRREAMTRLEIASQQKQYAQLVAYQQDIRQMYHDMKRHLHVIASLLTEGETMKALDYIRQQEVAISRAKLTVTGYSLIDSVLASKKELAQKQEIRLTCEAYWPLDMSLPEIDIAILLDNGLDNAIEAAAKLADHDKRWVSLALHRQLSQLHMTIRNPVSWPVDTSQELLPTTKEDADCHGLGMGNMAQLAHKHGGAMACDCRDGIFILRLMVDISNDAIHSADATFVPKD